MSSLKKKILFFTITFIFTAGLIELSSYIFFSLFKERFTFLKEKYVLSDEKIKSTLGFYDPVLGWNNSYDKTPYKERRRIVAYDKPLMATFGDSFTHCDEVSFQETWQTYLADLIKADIYNFGATAYGTDQAYLKFLSYYPTVKTPVVTLGLITENINRIVNVYRRFYTPTNAINFTKPRFELVDDQLVLIENSIKDPADFVKLQDPEFVEQLGQHDWWYNRDNYPAFGFPYTKILFNKRMWLEAYYGKGDKTIDDMTPRPWEDLWEVEPARKLMFKIIEAFVDKAKSYQATPIIMILPMKSDVAFYLKNQRLPGKAIMLLDHCRSQNYLCFEAISALANRVGSEHTIDQLYEQVHLSAVGNRFVAEAFFKFLEANIKTTLQPFLNKRDDS